MTSALGEPEADHLAAEPAPEVCPNFRDGLRPVAISQNTTQKAVKNSSFALGGTSLRNEGRACRTTAPNCQHHRVLHAHRYTLGVPPDNPPLPALAPCQLSVSPLLSQV